MGIFTRFRDIVNSNLNAMLDKAEDPEKLIKLMIQEMEDTLVEIKASCAGAMANRTRVSRALEESRKKADDWAAKAELAIQKGREDLAREALMLKKNFLDQVTHLENEVEQAAAVIDKYKADIQQLEEKLESTRNKHRILIQRHIQANKHSRAQKKIRQADTSDAFVRFDQFESRIDRMEAEADLINVARKPTLEDEFTRLESDEEIEKELSELKHRVSGKASVPPKEQQD
ncbi:MAG: phage shock protein PspA [Verrucomicrobia bacterium]|nr:phage shock protein PspA [Verrucomicrobiota bacterium]